VPCTPLPVPGGPVEVCFPAHGGWDSRDVSVASMCDCVKERMSFIMYLII
jgi:hypothetical protein